MINPDKPVIADPFMQPVAPKSRYINLRSGSEVTVIRSTEDTIIVKYDDYDKEVDYSLEYFDRVFNPVVNVELPDGN